MARLDGALPPETVAGERYGGEMMSLIDR
jgi:hypothetical protein